MDNFENKNLAESLPATATTLRKQLVAFFSSDNGPHALVASNGVADASDPYDL
jgi:hypothetical protein